ncbi:MAG: hypothetical protein QOE31_3304 [Solirubrobacteraceae bacterium]|jgi:hypothetical protein|nr:hypothetical protein [Solirubrobacteraceae bacterium]
MSITRRIAASIAGLCAVTALTVLPGPALAAGPADVRFHDSFMFDVSGEECGIAVEGTMSGVSNVAFYDGGNAIKASSSIKTTLTNPATGKSVVISLAGHGDGPSPVIDEQARTITFLSSFSGLWEKIQAPGAPATMVSAGVLGYEQVFDLDTGELISMQPTVQHGPHPGADKSLHCAAISDALL